MKQSVANESDEKDRGDSDTKSHRDKVSAEEVQVPTSRLGRVLAVGAFSACRGLAPAQAEISHDSFCFLLFHFAPSIIPSQP